MHPGRARVRGRRRAGQEVRRGGEALRRQEGRAADGRRRAQALPRAPHRLQGARARSSSARTCRRPTSARSCGASCATRRRRRRSRPHCGAPGADAPGEDRAHGDVTVALPDKEPALRVVPMPADANQHGDIFGGWIMSQVDIAGGVVAARRARGRVATVAVNSFVFKQPVLIGDLVSFYAEITRVGRTSITVDVEVYAQRNPTDVITRQGHRGEPDLRRRRHRSAAPRAAAGVRRRAGCRCQLATTARPRPRCARDRAALPGCGGCILDASVRPPMPDTDEARVAANKSTTRRRRTRRAYDNPPEETIAMNTPFRRTRIAHRHRRLRPRLGRRPGLRRRIRACTRHPAAASATRSPAARRSPTTRAPCGGIPPACRVPDDAGGRRAAHHHAVDQVQQRRVAGGAEPAAGRRRRRRRHAQLRAEHVLLDADQPRSSSSVSASTRRSAS